VIKLVGEVVLFVVEKNTGSKRNGGGRQKNRSSGHKLNITNEFTNKFKSVGNFICKMTCHCIFSFFFLFFYHYNSLDDERIFLSLFTYG
jgi:hypothetical protein